MNVSVIGTGYVGLVTGACLAEIGHQVVCMDDNPAKVEILLQARVPIYEPHLDQLVTRNIRNGRLRFTTGAAEVACEAAVIFICVNTPPRPDGEADLTYVELATRRIAEHATRDTIITEKSTVPVQTGQWIEKTLAIYKKRPGITFDVASNPEFTREGMAVEDFLHPDRIVVGVSSPRAEAALRELVVEKLKRALWILTGKKIGLLGLAFKPNTDDIREAPALAIARRLIEEGAFVQGYDPQAAAKAKEAVPDLAICADPYAVAERAEAVVLCTEWPEFAALDFGRLKASMVRPLILDGRNALDREKLTALGFEYIGIGRGQGGRREYA